MIFHKAALWKVDGIKIINKNGIKLCLDCMPLPSFGQMGEIVERLNSSMNHSCMVLTANDPNEGSKVIYDPDIQLFAKVYTRLVFSYWTFNLNHYIC